MHCVGAKSIEMRRFAFLSSFFHWHSARESVTRNLPIAESRRGGNRRDGKKKKKKKKKEIEELRNAFKMLKWSAIYTRARLGSARRSKTSCAHTAAGLSVCGQNRPQDSNRAETRRNNDRPALYLSSNKIFWWLPERCKETLALHF